MVSRSQPSRTGVRNKKTEFCDCSFDWNNSVIRWWLETLQRIEQCKGSEEIELVFFFQKYFYSELSERKIA